MPTPSLLFAVARHACCAFCLLAVLSLPVASQQTFNVSGKITWDSNKGTPNIPGAEVQILHPESPPGKRVWKATTADEAAHYEIDNVEAGKYEIVACDDLLTYRPRSQKIEVPLNASHYDLRLVRNDPAHALPFIVGTKKVIFLKHVETGCELAAIQTDPQGVASIPNTLDEATFNLEFVYCSDDSEERDSVSPFESCVKKQLPIGLTEDQVISKKGKPDKIIKQGERERTYVYRDAKVSFVNGKVSAVRVEIEAAACLLRMGCSGH